MLSASKRVFLVNKNVHTNKYTRKWRRPHLKRSSCVFKLQLATCVFNFLCGSLQIHQPQTSVNVCNSRDCLVALIKDSNISHRAGIRGGQ